MNQPADNRQWNQAPREVAYDDHTVLWSGRPSQWVNLYKITFWLAVMIGLAVGRHYWYTTWVYGLPRGMPAALISQAIDYLAIATCAVAALSIIYAVLYVLYERTTITVNHVREDKGITSIFRKTRYCELARVIDVKAPPAGLLALAGIGDIALETTDKDQPQLRIRGLRNRRDLIDRLLPVSRAVRKERREYFSR